MLNMKTKEQYEKDIENFVEKLEFIISKVKDNLINVFRLDSEEGGQDIELTILRAFLNCIYIYIFNKFTINNLIVLALVIIVLYLKKLERINIMRILNWRFNGTAPTWLNRTYSRAKKSSNPSNWRI